nr:MAG TPA: hypothetical protein [Caudoviricetes sp.]
MYQSILLQFVCLGSDCLCLCLLQHTIRILEHRKL